MSVKIKAYAKLNLTLGITGVKDGYHMLDSLVCSVDLYDLIKLKKRKDDKISVIMHGFGTESLPHEHNNAAKAAEAYVNAFRTKGADIEIFKNIPVGAGLGGSSADAAGVLTGMARLYSSGGIAALKTLADGLGSDTGYMLYGGFARLSGRGDDVRLIETGVKLHILLLLPRGGVSTADCYRAYDVSGGDKCDGNTAFEALASGDAEALAKEMNNALFKPACILNPEIKTAYEELQSFSPMGVNMTGSGSGVFAIFESAEMCEWAKSRYRGKMRCLHLKTVIPKNRGI